MGVTRTPRHRRRDWLNGAKREHAFARIMKGRGMMLEPNHRLFRFGLSYYVPDFLDRDRGVYYEVIGSRQRYQQMLPKLDLMRHCFPDIPLRIMTPTGEPWRGRRRQFPQLTEVAAECFSAAQERNLRLGDVAALAGVSPQYLSQALGGFGKSVRARTLRARVHEWTRTGTMPPALPDGTAKVAVRRVARQALADTLRQRIRERGMVRSAIARGLAISPQVLNDALHRPSGRPILDRIAAWLDGPGANGAGHVDLRRKEYRP